ncbi:MAG TPA: DMT family transporter [Anaeromyxobacteraceae bacterium]
MSPRAGGALLAAAAASLWGLWSLFLRGSALSGPAVTATVLACMALPLPFAFRRAALRDRGAVAALVLLGVADTGNAGFYFAALRGGPVAVAVLTHYLAPLLVALLAPPLLGEAPSSRAPWAAVASLVGLGLVLGRPRGAALSTALFGAASAGFYAVVLLSGKRALRSFGPLALNALHAPLSIALLLALFGRAALPTPSAGLGRLLAGALLCGVGANVLFYAGLRRITAQVASALTWLEPLAATAVGALVFGEQLAPTALLGASLVLASGVWVALEPALAPAVTRA